MEDEFSEEKPDPKFMLDWMRMYPASLEAKFAGSKPDDEDDKKSPDKPYFKRKTKIVDYTVGEELDLHGETVDQGIFAIEELIARALRARMECVRVIHGTGDVNSAHTLRTAVKRWLTTRGTKYIARWEYENDSEGAVIIWPRRA